MQMFEGGGGGVVKDKVNATPVSDLNILKTRIRELIPSILKRCCKKLGRTLRVT